MFRCGDLTILLLGLAFHCFCIEKKNRYATALAGHRAAILFNYRFYDDIINYYQKIVEYELENPGMDLSDDLTEEYRLIVKEYSRYNEEK